MISQLSDLFETLSTLNDIPCPSGKETAIQDVCKNLINPYINHIDQDVLYNQISWLKTESEKTVMLSAHIDEISFIVKNVDKRGFIWIQRVGGCDTRIAAGMQVLIHTQTNDIPGVVGYSTIKVAEGGRNGVLNLSENDVWVDVGVWKSRSLREIIKVGDSVTFKTDLVNLGEGIVSGRGLDNRLGVCALIHAARAIFTRGSAQMCVCYATTTQEEVGCRGAVVAASQVNPKLALCIDTILAEDTPSFPSRFKDDAIKVGCGPVIVRGPGLSPNIIDGLIECAQRLGIAYQLTGLATISGIESSVIQLNGEGVACGFLGIPTRYIHGPNEISSLKDTLALSELIAEWICTTNIK